MDRNIVNTVDSFGRAHMSCYYFIIGKSGSNTGGSTGCACLTHREVLTETWGLMV